MASYLNNEYKPIDLLAYSRYNLCLPSIVSIHIQYIPHTGPINSQAIQVNIRYKGRPVIAVLIKYLHSVWPS